MSSLSCITTLLIIKNLTANNFLYINANIFNNASLNLQNSCQFLLICASFSLLNFSILTLIPSSFINTFCGGLGYTAILVSLKCTGGILHGSNRDKLINVCLVVTKAMSSSESSFVVKSASCNFLPTSLQFF
jgi:hypothetical protein